MQLSKFGVARVFETSAVDAVDFGSLSPLTGSKEWSVLALIKPTEVHRFVGIVSKRTGFGAGTNHFTFWLKDGALSVEADGLGRQCELKPPLGQWSFVAATVSPDGSSMYLGVEGKVLRVDQSGIALGADDASLPLIVGRVGASFPGAIAFVALYSGKLPEAMMFDLCAGLADPLRVPRLLFAWVPSELGDVDLVSGRKAVVTGTKLVKRETPTPVPTSIGSGSQPKSNRRVGGATPSADTEPGKVLGSSELWKLLKKKRK